MKKWQTRFLAWLLCAALVIPELSLTAYAKETTKESAVTEEITVLAEEETEEVEEEKESVASEDDSEEKDAQEDATEVEAEEATDKVEVENADTEKKDEESEEISAKVDEEAEEEELILEEDETGDESGVEAVELKKAEFLGEKFASMTQSKIKLKFVSESDESITGRFRIKVYDKDGKDINAPLAILNESDELESVDYVDREDAGRITIYWTKESEASYDEGWYSVVLEQYWEEEWKEVEGRGELLVWNRNKAYQASQSQSVAKFEDKDCVKVEAKVLIPAIDLEEETNIEKYKVSFYTSDYKEIEVTPLKEDLADEDGTDYLLYTGYFDGLVGDYESAYCAVKYDNKTLTDLESLGTTHETYYDRVDADKNYGMYIDLSEYYEESGDDEPGDDEDENPVTAIRLNQSEGILIAKNAEFSSDILYAELTPAGVEAEIEWTSSNESIVTVDGAVDDDGKDYAIVTLEKEEIEDFTEVTVTATVEGTELAASCVYTVYPEENEDKWLAMLKDYSCYAVSGVEKTLNDVRLPEGWGWQYPETDLTALKGTVSRSFPVYHEFMSGMIITSSVPVTIVTITGYELKPLDGAPVLSKLTYNSDPDCAGENVYEYEISPVVAGLKLSVEELQSIVTYAWDIKCKAASDSKFIECSSKQRKIIPEKGEPYQAEVITLTTKAAGKPNLQIELNKSDGRIVPLMPAGLERLVITAVKGPRADAEDISCTLYRLMGDSLESEELTSDDAHILGKGLVCYLQASMDEESPYTLTYSTSNANIKIAKPSTITVNGETYDNMAKITASSIGAADIIITINDPYKTTKTIPVKVYDYSANGITLGGNSVSFNKQTPDRNIVKIPISNGCDASMSLIPYTYEDSRGSSNFDYKLTYKDEDGETQYVSNFAANLEDEYLVISCDDLYAPGIKSFTGKVNVSLDGLGTEENPNCKTFSIKVNVENKAAAVNVKQVQKKSNLYANQPAIFEITSPNGTILGVEYLVKVKDYDWDTEKEIVSWSDRGTLSLDEESGQWALLDSLNDEEIADCKNIMLRVYVEGYEEVKKAVKIAEESAKLSLTNASGSVYIDATSEEAYALTQLKNGLTGQIVDLESEEVEVELFSDYDMGKYEEIEDGYEKWCKKYGYLESFSAEKVGNQIKVSYIGDLYDSEENTGGFKGTKKLPLRVFSSNWNGEMVLWFNVSPSKRSDAKLDLKDKALTLYCYSGFETGVSARLGLTGSTCDNSELISSNLIIEEKVAKGKEPVFHFDDEEDGLHAEYDADTSTIKVSKKGISDLPQGTYTLDLKLPKTALNDNAKENEYLTASLKVKVVNVETSTLEGKNLSVKASGSIDVLNRELSVMTIIPKFKNVASDAQIICTGLSRRDSDLFEIEDDASDATGKAYLKLKDGVSVLTGYNYEVSFVYRVESNGATMWNLESQPVKIKLVQKNPKFTIFGTDNFSVLRSVEKRFNITAMSGAKPFGEVEVAEIKLVDGPKDFQLLQKLPDDPEDPNGYAILYKPNGATVAGKAYTLKFEVTLPDAAANAKPIFVTYKVKVTK